MGSAFAAPRAGKYIVTQFTGGAKLPVSIQTRPPQSSKGPLDKGG
jgi:hypothetical protein